MGGGRRLEAGTHQEKVAGFIRASVRRVHESFFFTTKALNLKDSRRIKFIRIILLRLRK